MTDITKMKKQYDMQRWNAINKRGIEWQLTFDEWKEIWLSSGKYDQRGPKKGQYCMCRFNDTGPYAVWNVRIDTMEENNKEAKPLVLEGTKKRWSSEEERQKHSIAMKNSDKFKEAMKNRPVGDRTNNIEAIRKSKTKPIVATNIETGYSFELYGETHIKQSGFNPSAVSLCANKKQKSHKGYAFEFLGE